MSSPHILHVAGMTSCGFYKRISGCLGSLSLLFPNRLKVVEHEFADKPAFRQWLVDDGFRNNFGDEAGKKHVSSPVLWFSKTPKEGDPDPADIERYLGGYDASMEWARGFMRPSEESNTPSSILMKDDGHSADHGYDYDLVVIGGGSGGMAAAKEAAELGAKVALCDFVKPSPMGTKWGLGGTCVNVGCIPKKLYHIGAGIKENMEADARHFGLTVGDATPDMMDELPELKAESHWKTAKMSIQNYIRSLNFKYRVRLREKSVQYLNKLASFKDPHTLEVVDKKGAKSDITASRVLVAVGGRPAPLDCEGGELAISSDDVFFLEKGPGKTLCVGASYISLECAGFISAMGYDTTVAVRSILLRGFDRECADKIGENMKSHGVKFMMKVTPTKLEKVENDQIKVTFSDGTSDTFDTVLGAIGRHADTDKLGLENVGVKINPKNKKILAEYEQTETPNIYAVGDVMEGCPELTPVAIQAGIMLSRRLFGKSQEPMDYVNVCTTVFTPLEYSCVGLSEDDAKEQLGMGNIEVYHREFTPLEWSISEKRHNYGNGFAKVVVDKTENEKVLGIHYLGPNAGEVMQGYGVSMKKGMTFKELTDTVGIHPTSSEEIVTLSITKSSGEDAAAGGC